LGQVAAGIAHEIRNPLVGIGSTATLLLEDFEPSDSRHEDLQIILKETRRLDRIVNQIVDFARPRDLLPLTFSLADLIQESLHVLGGPLKEKAVCVSFDPPVQLPAIRADRDQLKQVILNIIQNALEAVAPQGHLELFLAEELYEQELGVRLRVVDNGKGISPRALPRIFEPFFTIGKIRGTGLGLAICRNIIESHGGEIHAESQEGHGTTISIWLPCQLQPQPLTV
ncbi:MAG: histidine kinase, partial [Nitrospira sp.]|nr:histidine kinase [Nitrospira sp.]